jgi:hypothetical protein
MIVTATGAEVYTTNITTQGANVSVRGTAGIMVTGLRLDILAESLGTDIIALVLITVDVVKTDHELMSVDFVGDFRIRIHKMKGAATAFFFPIGNQQGMPRIAQCPDHSAPGPVVSAETVHGGFRPENMIVIQPNIAASAITVPYSIGMGDQEDTVYTGSRTIKEPVG